jgi:hypothetical protein
LLQLDLVASIRKRLHAALTQQVILIGCTGELGRVHAYVERLSRRALAT